MSWTTWVIGVETGEWTGRSEGVGLSDTKVNISDVLDNALVFVSSPDPELNFGGGAVTVNNALVKAGTTRAFSFKAKVDEKTAANTKFNNSATIFPLDGSKAVIVQTGYQRAEEYGCFRK